MSNNITYTTTSSDIYFLNDKNIAFNLSDDAAGLNVVASYNLVHDVSSTTSAAVNQINDNIDSINLSVNAISNMLSSLSTDYILTDDSGVSVITKLEQINGQVSISAKQLVSSDIGQLSDCIATLTNDIAGISTSTNNEFVHISGDSINGNLSVSDSLCVTNNLSVGGVLRINTSSNSIAIGNNASNSYNKNTFVWSGHLDDGIIAPKNQHGTFTIDPENGVEGVFIGNTNLCTMLSNELTGLSTNLSTSIYNNYLLNSDLSIVYKKKIEDDTATIELIDIRNDKPLGIINATDFLVDGVLSTVSLDSTKQILKFVWNTDAGNNTIEIPLSTLSKIYEGRDGIEINGNIISANNTIARTSDLTALSNKVEALSSTTINTISADLDTLEQSVDAHDTNLYSLNKYIDDLSVHSIPAMSNDINTLKLSAIDHEERIETNTDNIELLSNHVIPALKRDTFNMASYRGHINITTADINTYPSMNLSAIFKAQNLAEGDNVGAVKNGAIFNVTFDTSIENNPENLAKQKITTKDSFIL